MTYRAIIPISIIFLALGIGVTTSQAPIIEELSVGQEYESPHQLSSNVQIHKNGELIAEETNVMLDGREIIRQEITDDTADGSESYTTIALGNADNEDNVFDETMTDLTDPTGAVRYSYGSDDGNMENVVGFEPQSVSIQNTDAETTGSWEIEATFEHQDTDAGTVDVGTTAIEVDAGDDTAFQDTTYNTFSATAFGRTIPMENQDQITVTWTVDPQNP